MLWFHWSSDTELSVCRFSFNDFINQDCVSHSYGVETKTSASESSLSPTPDAPMRSLQHPVLYHSLICVNFATLNAMQLEKHLSGNTAYTKQNGLMVTDFYSGGPQLKPPIEHHLSWLTFLAVFLSPSRPMPGSLHSKFFPVHQSCYHWTLYSEATDSGVNKLQKTLKKKNCTQYGICC